MRSKMLPILLGVVIIALIIGGILYLNNQTSVTTASPTQETNSAAQSQTAVTGPASMSTEAPSGPSAAASNTAPDLTVDANGLSKATVVMNTSQGMIKFKFYPKDAPNTVNRIAELVSHKFYDGLTFHRVVPGFVIQGGDPQGNGTGGSGQKLKAEFNSRKHVEGTVAMARAQDPDSADSQFYISLGVHPHLDRNYTVFGQVTEGMDVVRKIKIGDKIVSMAIQ